MTAMLSPDLLDRRALALLRLVDVSGRPVSERVFVHGDQIDFARKRDGSVAILNAAGLEDYSASFIAPSSPATASLQVPIDLEPSGTALCSRRFVLNLPRTTDPAKASDPASIFQAVEIEMLAGSGWRLTGSACALRVTVRRKSDAMLIQNALVRARTEDGQFEVRGLTDVRGEATLVFPSLPLAVPGAGANVISNIAAKVVVTVDPASASFNDLRGLPQPSRSLPPFPDPDSLGAVAADFASGADVTIGAGRNVPLEIEWAEQ